jgi:hypothetical protein
MITSLYLIVAVLSLAMCFVIIKIVGKFGFFIIFSYLILIIPDRFFIRALTDIYFNLDLGRITNIAVWLESGMSLTVILSLAFSLVGFLLIKREEAGADAK